MNQSNRIRIQPLLLTCTCPIVDEKTLEQPGTFIDSDQRRSVFEYDVIKGYLLCITTYVSIGDLTSYTEILIQSKSILTQVET